MKYNVLLSEIKEAGSYTDQELSGILGVSKNFLNKNKSINDLRLDQLSRLSEELDCSVETFAQGMFDLDVLKSKKDQIQLPKRYQMAAFSKIRTSSSLFQFIESYFGEDYKNRILKTLQVKNKHLENQDENISMRLVIDIANLLSFRKVNPITLQKMGEFSAFSNRVGRVGEFFSECRTVTEVYEKLVPVMGDFFEKNHHYKILKLNKNECWIEAKTSQLVQDSLSKKCFGSMATCDVRSGVAGSFSLYVGKKVKKVNHPLCMHRGDPACVYHVFF